MSSSALPSAARPRLPASAWPLKRLVTVLALVLGMHLWLLGGLPLHWPRDAVSGAQETPTLAFHTRVLPAVAAPPPLAPPSPPRAPRPPLPQRVPAPSKPQNASPARESSEPLSEPLMPLARTDIAQLAIESIAEPARTQDREMAANAPPADPPAPPQERAHRYAFPPPVQLNYDVYNVNDGRKNVVSAAILWQHDGANYQSSLVISKFYLKIRQWTSKGALAETGLEPVRFGEKGLRSEVAAHFVRDQGKIVFSANTPDAPLLPGAQDHLSVFIQLASMWAGAPQRYMAGDSVRFQSVGPRQAESWTFTVAPEETIAVPGGKLHAIKLTREASEEYSTRAEVWLAPQLGFLPAHIRLTEGSNNVLDMVWTDSQQP